MDHRLQKESTKKVVKEEFQNERLWFNIVNPNY